MNQARAMSSRCLRASTNLERQLQVTTPIVKAPLKKSNMERSMGATLKPATRLAPSRAAKSSSKETWSTTVAPRLMAISRSRCPGSRARSRWTPATPPKWPWETKKSCVNNTTTLTRWWSMSRWNKWIRTICRIMECCFRIASRWVGSRRSIQIKTWSLRVRIRVQNLPKFRFLRLKNCWWASKNSKLETIMAAETEIWVWSKPPRISSWSVAVTTSCRRQRGTRTSSVTPTRTRWPRTGSPAKTCTLNSSRRNRPIIWISIIKRNWRPFE